MNSDVFGHSASGFTAYFFNGRTGFTSPTWIGLPAVNIGDDSAVAVWLIENGLPHDTSLQADPNGDGVNLLMAYALKLDPRLNLGGSMPGPELVADQMRLTFFAGNSDITYRVESSTDVRSWGTEGFTLSSPDDNCRRTATVLITSSSCFMRVVVEH